MPLSPMTLPRMRSYGHTWRPARSWACPNSAPGSSGSHTIVIGSFLGLSKFSTWLFRIAYNCYIDHCRKAKPEQTSVDDALEIPAAESSDSAFRYQQLYRAMDRLPEKEKASISLFYFEDRSIKEIAAILGIPQGTVKYHLSMGRTHLKQHIQL